MLGATFTSSLSWNYFHFYDIKITSCVFVSLFWKNRYKNLWRHNFPAPPIKLSFQTVSGISASRRKCQRHHTLASHLKYNFPLPTVKWRAAALSSNTVPDNSRILTCWHARQFHPFILRSHGVVYENCITGRVFPPRKPSRFLKRSARSPEYFIV